MYLAQSSNISNTQSSFYVSILESIIDDSSTNYKKDIDIAIKEASEVAKGIRKVFSINKNHHFFITTLLIDYKEKLLSINDDFGTETYREILDVLR